MKTKLIALLATLSLHAHAQPPAARLEVSGVVLAGEVTEVPLFEVPSCDLLKQRLNYLQKQSEEMSASIATLHEVRRGMLTINDLLRRPWINTHAQFALESLQSGDLEHIQARAYGVSYSLSGRLWESQNADTPDGVSITTEASKLILEFTQTGLEYCYPVGPIFLSLSLQ